jgi:hypothetical protein
MFTFPLRRCVPALLVGLLACAASVQAQTPPLPVSVGAGMRSSFVHTGAQTTTGSTDRFLLDSARIYLNGTVTPVIKFTFNTEYNGVTNAVGVMDAIGRFEVKEHFNIWAGRFLPPSDRANLHGPYYAHEWGSFIDGIQDGYPTTAVGRADGMAYWGDFGKAKVSVGAFDGPTTIGNPNATKVLTAARFQYDFLDPEKGYYLNGTYYGGKKVLGLGGAVQNQSGNTAATADLLFETKVSGGGVISIQSEYSYYDNLGGYNPSYALSRGAFIMGSYMFGQKIGTGNIEILGKYAEASFDRGANPIANPNYKQKTSEGDLSYIIKEFNARVTAFYTNRKFSAVKSDVWTLGLGLQIQM